MPVPSLVAVLVDGGVPSGDGRLVTYHAARAAVVAFFIGETHARIGLRDCVIISVTQGIKVGAD